uniref:Gag polyprotein n=1 Tax=Bovine foamy virus TaxID=207343 RepID=A0A8E4G0Y5_9RETR|nr:gag protein [Bovine foamy virus]BCT98170.1 gag protein [Bovine foamy virus]
MALNDFDPIALQGYLPAPRVLQHNDIIICRATSGPWGIGDRYNLIRIHLQDPAGQPLPIPQWEPIPNRTANPRTQPYPVVSAPMATLENILNNFHIPHGVSRYGPLEGGDYQPGEQYSQGFCPVTQAEIALLNGQHLEEEITILREITHRLMQGVRPPAVPQGPAPPPPPAQPPAPLPAPPIGPPPPAAPAPAPGPMPAPQHLPITHIRAVIGETPANIREVPLWLARAVPALQGVYPVQDAVMRSRTVNALTVRHPGLALEPLECGSWQECLAALWQRTFGATALHALGDTLGQIANSDGIVMAIELGLLFSDDNWDLVWGICRRFLPGQAVCVAVQARLDPLPDNATRIVMISHIIRDVYAILGLDPLGRPMQQTLPRRNNQPPRQQPQRRQQPRRTGNQEERGQRNRGRQNAQAPRQEGNRLQNSQLPGPRDYPNNSNQPRYPLRPNPQQPQRYGQEQNRGNNPNPYRQPTPGNGNQNRNFSRGPAPVNEQSRGRGRSSQGTNNTGSSAVHSVRLTSAAPPIPPQDAGTPPTSSGNQGQSS